MSSKIDFPRSPNSPDSIQILIDVFEETRVTSNDTHQQQQQHHHQQHHHQQQQQSSDVHQRKQQQQQQQLPKLKLQLQKHSHSSAGKTQADASGGNGFLVIQENMKRERRNSWCSSRPSEALANLKRKWFAGVTSNGIGKALTGDDNDGIEPDKSKR